MRDLAGSYRIYPGASGNAVFFSRDKLKLAELCLESFRKFRLKTWAKTWRWGFISLLFGRRHRLWAPRPSLATTHMASSFLSPVVDWRRRFSDSQHECRPL